MHSHHKKDARNAVAIPTCRSSRRSRLPTYAPRTYRIAIKDLFGKQPSQTGSPLKQTRATATTVDPPDPPELSPQARFIRANLAQSQTDSPLQDHSSVKKAKLSNSEIEEGDAIPQDLSGQFESLADIRIEPPAVPQ